MRNIDVPLLYNPRDFDSQNSDSYFNSPVRKRSSANLNLVLNLRKFSSEFIDEQNHKKAAFYSLLNVLNICLVQLLAKLLFINNPNLNEFEYLCLRSITHTLAIVIILNKTCKQKLSIRRDQSAMVFMRTVIGVVTYYFIFQALRVLPMFFVALIINLLLIFTVFLTYFILLEKIQKLDKISLIIAFIGLFVLFEGGNPQAENDNFRVLRLSLLVFAAMLIVAGKISQKKRSDIDPYLISFYTSIFSIFTFGIIAFLIGEFVETINSLSTASVLLIAISGILLSLQAPLLQKALENDTPSRVSLYNNLSPLIQILLDFLLIGTNYYYLEMIGSFIILVANGIMIYATVKKLF